MDIEQKLRASLLLEIYGKLLTEKQRDFMDLFVNDMSFAEIAENYDISPQAAYDLVARTVKVLEGYEQKLQLLKKFNEVKAAIGTIIEKLETSTGNDGIIDRLNKVIKLL